MTLLFFDDPGADDVLLFGGKAASLAKLGSAGRIPPGFSISVDSYSSWVDDGSDQMPPDVSAEIKQAYRALERTCAVIDVPVAVRSSAVDEDGIGESFAGRHWTAAHSRLVLHLKSLPGSSRASFFTSQPI